MMAPPNAIDNCKWIQRIGITFVQNPQNTIIIKRQPRTLCNEPNLKGNEKKKDIQKQAKVSEDKEKNLQMMQ